MAEIRIFQHPVLLGAQHLGMLRINDDGSVIELNGGLGKSMETWLWSARLTGLSIMVPAWRRYEHSCTTGDYCRVHYHLAG
jgi:hypothetical protein